MIHLLRYYLAPGLLLHRWCLFTTEHYPDDYCRYGRAVLFKCLRLNHVDADRSDRPPTRP